MNRALLLTSCFPCICFVLEYRDAWYRAHEGHGFGKDWKCCRWWNSLSIPTALIQVDSSQFPAKIGEKYLLWQHERPRQLTSGVERHTHLLLSFFHDLTLSTLRQHCFKPTQLPSSNKQITYTTKQVYPGFLHFAALSPSNGAARSELLTSSTARISHSLLSGCKTRHLRSLWVHRQSCKPSMPMMLCYLAIHDQRLQG